MKNMLILHQQSRKKYLKTFSHLLQFPTTTRKAMTITRKRMFEFLHELKETSRKSLKWLELKVSVKLATQSESSDTCTRKLQQISSKIFHKIPSVTQFCECFYNMLNVRGNIFFLTRLKPFGIYIPCIF